MLVLTLFPTMLDSDPTKINKAIKKHYKEIVEIIGEYIEKDYNRYITLSNVIFNDKSLNKELDSTVDKGIKFLIYKTKNDYLINEDSYTKRYLNELYKSLKKDKKNNTKSSYLIFTIGYTSWSDKQKELENKFYSDEYDSEQIYNEFCDLLNSYGPKLKKVFKKYKNEDILKLEKGDVAGDDLGDGEWWIYIKQIPNIPKEAVEKNKDILEKDGDTK